MGNRTRIFIYFGAIYLTVSFFPSPGLCQRIPKKTPELLNQGKNISGGSCTSCHGPTGNGKGPLSTTLKTPPADFTKPFSQWNHTKGEPKKIFDAISDGIPGTAMAKFHYTEQERWALVYAVMEFGKQKPE